MSSITSPAVVSSETTPRGRPVDSLALRVFRAADGVTASGTCEGSTSAEADAHGGICHTDDHQEPEGDPCRPTAARQADGDQQQQQQ